MKLKSKDQLAQHVNDFQGIEPERKKQIAEHLGALPIEQHAAVRTVLTDGHADDPESKFIYGCFDQPPALAPKESSEHPGFQPAA